jgi:starch phosphorylase
LLPRHLEIIYEINRRFLDEVHLRYPGDDHKIANLSLIDEHGEKYVRMAHLACVGSHAINGVAALHSELLKETTLRDFYELFPQKFSNKTNGVTPRRWMVLSNPKLSQLITEKIGEGWIKNLYELNQLEYLVEDSNFRLQWRQIKREVKQDLAHYIEQKNNLIVDPNSLFDVQVKRIHEYKRQHLNVLHIVSLYLRLKNNPNLEIAPRTFIFGGKAAPGYFMAKLIIKFINAVAEVVNNDPLVRDRLKVVFLSDYNVKLGQRVYPAADLSEQISTAGKEASGSGWIATVSILVRDASNNPVYGADVAGRFSVNTTRYTCRTDDAGTCSVTISLKKSVSSTSFSVNAISGDLLTYDSRKNTVSTISVAR